ALSEPGPDPRRGAAARAYAGGAPSLRLRRLITSAEDAVGITERALHRKFASAAQLADQEEGENGQDGAGAGEGDHRVVGARPVVKKAADPGAERGADSGADADGAEDRRFGGAAEDVHRDARDERAARAEHP